MRWWLKSTFKLFWWQVVITLSHPFMTINPSDSQVYTWPIYSCASSHCFLLHTYWMFSHWKSRHSIRRPRKPHCVTKQSGVDSPWRRYHVKFVVWFLISIVSFYGLIGYNFHDVGYGNDNIGWNDLQMSFGVIERGTIDSLSNFKEITRTHLTLPWGFWHR